MKIALVKPPNVGVKVRGMGFYVHRLYEALRRINGLKIDPVDFSYFPFLYHQYDLVHFPYFDNFFLTLPPIMTRPFVVTVPDLTQIIFPYHFPKGFRGELKWSIQKNLVTKARAIITISNSAKKDIQSFFNYPQNKIFTTYLAADEKFRVVKSKNKYNLPDPFVLYVGGVNWNKNLPNLIKACQKINTPLILVGKEFLNTNLNLSHPELQSFKEILKLIKKDPLIKCLGFVSTEDLVDIYNLASVYVQPSIYEGFGLPVLEALSCGCPVICGKNSSLPEIGGEAAIYTDTLNIEKLSQSIFNVIHLAKIQRENIIQKSLAQAKKFSWAKTARETYEIYQKVLVRE